MKLKLTASEAEILAAALANYAGTLRMLLNAKGRHAPPDLEQRHRATSDLIAQVAKLTGKAAS